MQESEPRVCLMIKVIRRKQLCSYSFYVHVRFCLSNEAFEEKWTSPVADGYRLINSYFMF